MKIAVPKALGNGTVGLRLCQSSAVLVKADAVLTLTPFHRDGSHQADAASS